MRHAGDTCLACRLIDLPKVSDWQGIVDRVDSQAKLDQNVTTIPVAVTVLNPYGGGFASGGGVSGSGVGFSMTAS